MTTTTPTLFAVLVGEPLALAKAQPHQVLLSTGSVAIMAQFAAHSGIVDPLVGYCIAAGVEWAYLRGLASDTKATTWWGAALNWSAFGIVVLWGILWVATIYGAIPAKPTGALAFLVAAAHVVPIAWLSLCSAMCHRAAGLAEQKRLMRIQQERDLIQLDTERKQAEIVLWESGQAAKMRLQNARTKMRTNARPARANAEQGKCPKCKAELTQAQWLAACRWGHCASCKDA